MKGDYVPYDVKLDNPKKTQYDIYTGPFTSPTINEVNYLQRKQQKKKQQLFLFIQIQIL